MATVRKSDPTIPTPTIHTEKLSGVIKIFALTEGAAMLIAEAEYFMVRDVNFVRPTNQPAPPSSLKSSKKMIWKRSGQRTRITEDNVTLR